MTWVTIAAARRARAGANSAVTADSPQSLPDCSPSGTIGTNGAGSTTGTGSAVSAGRMHLDPITIEALADAFNERLAICTADGISEAEAQRTAEAEIGAEFARYLLGKDWPA